MITVRLALKSLRARWFTALLTVIAIAISVMLLLGVDKLRTGARQSFVDTISGTDLIVGARSGSIQLMLYSVFRIGNATNNISWQSYKEIEARPEVRWAVPMSLGDSHRGFRVLGTTRDYFEHYRYRRDQKLGMQSGKVFDDLFDAVVGSDVAAKLGYKVGDRIVIGHGLGSVSFVEHSELPFVVSGILARTGTPVDRTVHVSLEAIEAIHVGWQDGAPAQGAGVKPEDVRSMNLEPKAVTAALIGLRSKLAIFRLQRDINDYMAEPLSAVLPGLALQELWQLVGTAETALAVISAMVVATALIGMVIMILTTLNERRREMAILRSVGAGPRTIVGLMVAEAGVLTVLGVVLGVLLTYVGLAAMQPAIEQVYGIHVPISILAGSEGIILAGIISAGFVIGLVPAYLAYRMSVADGMLVRI
ncbi:MAG: hypothetical protein RLZ98_2797 [Pseudomonadota bacterium]|jgi:putative ABC transport system permease protein